MWMQRGSDAGDCTDERPCHSLLQSTHPAPVMEGTSVTSWQLQQAGKSQETWGWKSPGGSGQQDKELCL